ncbi:MULTISPECIES: EAL domain-containing protein [Pseudoalteromonas]|jgi:EAL domain-containing protein (putative c-di-GMP-specific phosphodiesterase class I)/ActR/RegA family two-component response regulator|uniref:EAL domain-containing response regulator n=1 Tax=Pseudoalteromonas neustonica TaxID=1840331 RepID=A0ABY3FD75_9GAMM|nr:MULTISPECIES: EAL domain-containing response regulator [Pseudoalteromonas]MBB1292816.1 EAL domain-containing response regulator [Pseudoalteromonas sp. SR41-4]MBB1310213.1 EAL domain-containing response regulator [Pseudoalteromonas sp. SR41-8]MBB1398946.1 EAL domain-containing response regulator [Pseudoalteromonas sp. SG44-8]MBB1410011.1 EAL domain-containing response regulator [Pseudoalteromonas sp. SG44-17]MBB1506462.1 EAL domain-containing response regulator [Pseudoalteromonas sp. SG41-1]|tara:strand:+ start:544 stop:1764 length:1221 start_codon:yes stop_codon:yes gene_type:complete
MTKLARSILVVDDSKAILVVMQAILNELNVPNVTTCLNAQDALNKVKTNLYTFDAVFTDLNMPDMDGMELIRHLGDIQYPGAIVIISEMNSKIIDLAADLARKNNVHLIGNIAKPVQLNQVYTLLQKLEYLACHTEKPTEPISETQLLHAISHNEITPFYQPKVNRNSNKVESIEVLARIVTAEQGAVLLPERFICVAEDLDLINLITFQLFEKATGDFSEIKTRLGYKLKLAFNLSPCQLEDLSCPDKLALILHLNQLTPSEIILEITEQHALSSSAQLETLNRLRMRGFGISLDDFGTGFTNVQQLKTLPFTEVKIDRTLISNIESDLFSQVIVSSLVNIAIQDDLTIVAEGIERVEELEYLERFKEHILMQGFLISRPKGKTEFIRWAQSWLHMVSLNSHSRR